MISSLLLSANLLSEKHRTAEEEDARIESLRVAVPLYYGVFALSALTSVFWALGIVMAESKSDLAIYIFPLFFAVLAYYAIRFVRKAKSIIRAYEVGAEIILRHCPVIA